MSEPCSDSVVLIVEDDRDIRESILEALEDNDYHPVGASNGKEALDKLRHGMARPCVILLDIMMPIMDGWQFRALQREDPELSSIPVVVLTAHTSIEDASQRMHAAACLKKPVPLSVLLSTVNRLCRSA
jgi:CheY-like chemotaxis protein